MPGWHHHPMTVPPSQDASTPVVDMPTVPRAYRLLPHLRLFSVGVGLLTVSNGTNFALQVSKADSPALDALVIAFGAIAVAVVAATAVFVFRRPRIRLVGTTLLWSRRRIPADTITRAGLVEKPPVRTLLLGHAPVLSWPIVIDDADGSLDEHQRHALVAFLEATAIDLPAVKPDRYDPQGRFAHVGDGSLTRARAIELVVGKGEPS